MYNKGDCYVKETSYLAFKIAASLSKSASLTFTIAVPIIRCSLISFQAQIWDHASFIKN
jgi:hypothetical protein